eukprot:scaffold2360_cov380-Prasinococcus_capsulatus_cf.AAC.8
MMVSAPDTEGISASSPRRIFRPTRRTWHSLRRDRSRVRRPDTRRLYWSRSYLGSLPSTSLRRCCNTPAAHASSPSAREGRQAGRQAARKGTSPEAGCPPHPTSREDLDQVGTPLLPPRCVQGSGDGGLHSYFGPYGTGTVVVCICRDGQRLHPRYFLGACGAVAPPQLPVLSGAPTLSHAFEAACCLNTHALALGRSAPAIF